jgi:carboxyl-terminal processing protease
VLKGINETLTQRAFVPNLDFKAWDAFLAKNQKAIDDATTIQAFSGAINRTLREFGISHIRLLDPRAAAARGRTTTIGMGVMASPVDGGGLRVTRVAEGSPAAEVGLVPQDVIVEVNGKKATSADDLRGDKGVKLELKVKKVSGEEKALSVELKEYSTVRKETLAWPQPDTAHLRIFTFSAGYGRENIEKLLTDAAKAKNLILDLRNNGGGAANNLNHLLSLLMPDKTAYGVFVSRRLVDDFKKEKPEAPVTLEAVAAWAPRKTETRKRTLEPFKGRIVVLINRGSGSASEIAASSLRENVGAQLVGSPSAGAVLASVFGRLPEGFSIQYPVSDWISIKGMRLEKNPLKPDVDVSVARITDADKDPVVEAAVKLLNEPPAK